MGLETDQYGGRIVQQQKKLGASCDWDRARFTMDEGCSKAVRETFCELYEKGLIYKGSRIINWCPHCVTALSDAEVEYQDKPGHLWHIRYPLADGSGDLVVATTRPETMMGDTGVAVNPNDERYKHLVGKTCILPLMDREIPIASVLPMWNPTFSAPNIWCRMPERMCSPVCCCILSNRQAQSRASCTAVPGAAVSGRSSMVCQMTPPCSWTSVTCSTVPSGRVRVPRSAG